MDVGQTTNTTYYKCHTLVTTGDKAVSHRLLSQNIVQCDWGKHQCIQMENNYNTQGEVC